MRRGTRLRGSYLVVVVCVRSVELCDEPSCCAAAATKKRCAQHCCYVPRVPSEYNTQPRVVDTGSHATLRRLAPAALALAARPIMARKRRARASDAVRADAGDAQRTRRSQIQGEAEKDCQQSSSYRRARVRSVTPVSDTSFASTARVRI